MRIDAVLANKAIHIGIDLLNKHELYNDNVSNELCFYRSSTILLLAGKGDHISND